MDDVKPLMQGFYEISVEERLRRVQLMAHLTDEEVALLQSPHSCKLEVFESLVENVIGFYPMPFGVATYFQIDGRDVLIPMVIEETSVIAAASGTAKWIRKNGRIRTYSRGRLIIGQIQIPYPKDLAYATQILHENREFLIQLANAFVPGLCRRGGGVRDIVTRQVPCFKDEANPQGSAESDQMIVLHVLCDPCDAMGANLINQVCEALKPTIEQLIGHKVGICILSNLADSCLVGAEVVVHHVPPEIGLGVVEAYRFAEVDPYRATTHNKGILNGIDAVLLATGNDWRAVEAAVHSYASRDGRVRPVTQWKYEKEELTGQIEIPLAVGTVGGMTLLHPIARIALKIMGVQKAEELARICAAVGLVQNLGAIKALSGPGIVDGHMKLHATNLALAAGAEIHELPVMKRQLAEILKKEKHIGLTRAQEVLNTLRVSGYEGYEE